MAAGYQGVVWEKKREEEGRFVIKKHSVRNCLLER
tara:strand:- start:321 stop:425 length:105 start_codon:yes stop_codon:yes gene_type:complete